VFPVPSPGEEDEELDLGDLLLTPGASIEGRVLDASGSPLPEVRIGLSGPSEIASPVELDPFVKQRSTFTGEKGRFLLGGLAGGTWRVRLSEPSGGAVEKTITLAVGQRLQGLVWHFEIGGRLNGIVRESSGFPVGSAWVDLVPGHGQAGTPLQVECDGEGAFEFLDVPVGPYSLLAGAPVRGSEESSLAPLLETVLQNVRADGGFVEVVLERGSAWIEGVVRDAGGNPAPLALVSRDWGDGRLHDGVLTDADGRFRVRVAPHSRSTLRAWPTLSIGPEATTTALELRLKRLVVDSEHPRAISTDLQAGARNVELHLKASDD